MRWKIAFRNLRRNHRRNLVSGMAIAFACAGLILMGSYLLRTERYLRASTVYVNHNGHVSIYRSAGIDRYLTRPNRYSLTGEQQKKIRETLALFPEVEFVGQYLLGIGLVSTGCVSAPFLATGIEKETDARVRSHPQVQRWSRELVRVDRGRPISGTDSEDVVTVTGRLGQVIGKERVLDEAPASGSTAVPDCADAKARAKLGEDADVQLLARTFRGDFSALDARIVAHHSTGLAFAEETSLIAPTALLQRLYDTDRVTYLGVFLKPDAAVAPFLERLSAALRERGVEDVSVYPFFDEKIGFFYSGVMNFLYTMASFFYVLAVGMIAVTLTNFLTLAILERRRELGTLRAIGFTVKEINGLMMLESAALSLVSAAAGVVISLCVIVVVNALQIRFRPPGIAGDMPFLLVANAPLCLGVAVGIGIVAFVTAAVALRKRTREGIVTLLQG